MKRYLERNGALVVLLGWAAAAAGQAYVWTLDGAGQWTTVANWAGQTNFANGVGHIADFSQVNITGSRNVTLGGGGTITVGKLIFGDTDTTHRYQFIVEAGTQWVFDNGEEMAEIYQTRGSTANSMRYQLQSPFRIDSHLLITHMTAGDNQSTRFLGELTEGVAGRNVIKAGPGSIHVEGNWQHTGATYVSNGVMSIALANGRLSGTSAIYIHGGMLVISNGTAANTRSDRINVAAPIESRGGRLDFGHSAASTVDYSQTLGALTLQQGHFTLYSRPAATGRTATMTFAEIGINAVGSTFFTIDADLLSDNRNRVLVTTAPALAAPAGGDLSAILPRTIARVGSTGTGADWQIVTHDGDGTSLRAYGAGANEGFADAWSTAAWVATTNARPMSSQAVGTGGGHFNTLILDDGIHIAASGGDREMRFNTAGSAAMLVQTGGASEFRADPGNANSEIVLTFGNNTGVFYTVGTLRLIAGNANDQVRGQNGFIKAGPGTLILDSRGQAASATVANRMLGTFFIHEGTVELWRQPAAGGTVIELSGGNLVLRNNTGTAFRPQDVTITNTPVMVSRNGSIVVARASAGSALTHEIGDITLRNGATLTVNNENFNNNANAILSGNTLRLESSAGLNIRTAPGNGSGRLMVAEATDNGGGFSLDVIGNALLRSDFRVTGNLTLGGNLTVGADGQGANVRVGDGFENVAGNVTVYNGIIGSSVDVTKELGAGAGHVRFLGGYSAGISAGGADATFTFTQGGNPVALVWGSEFFAINDLRLNEANAGATVTLANDIDLNSGDGNVTRTIAVDSTIGRIAGDIFVSGTGTAGLTKTSGSMLWLTGNLTYGGATRITGGHIRVDDPDDLPSGNLNLNPTGSNAVLESSGIFKRGLGDGAGQVQLVGSGTGNSRVGFSAFGGDLIVDIGGNGNGSGAELVWNTQFFDPDGSKGTGGFQFNTTYADSTVYFLNNIDLAGESEVTVRRFDVNASTTVLAGVLRNSLEGFSEIGILKRGTGTLTLSGNNTYDGATQIENGTLVLGDGGASGTAGAGDIELLAVTARLGFNRSDSLTVDNLISGSGSVVQLGSGTTDLTVANTYTGGTTIQNGILKVSNLTGSGTGSGTVTVKSGGRLSGTGIITGNITIETDGILAPGSSFGTLSGVNLSLQDGAKLQWELSGNATEYGNGQYDKLVLSGGLEADDKAEFDFLGTGYWSGSPTVYTLIQFAGTTTVNAETFTIRENSLAPGLSSGGFAVVYNNDLDMNELQLTVIPEPASLGLLGAVAVAAILRRRIR